MDETIALAHSVCVFLIILACLSGTKLCQVIGATAHVQSLLQIHVHMNAVAFFFPINSLALHRFLIN